MKKIFFTFLLLAVILNACATEPAATSDNSAAINAVYTSVAETLSAPATVTIPTQVHEITSTPFASQPTFSTVPASGEIPVPTTVVSTAIPCDSYAYVSDVTIPDGTILAPGATFTKTWRIFNSGSCNWTTKYKLVFVSGTDMGGVATAMTAAINSGGQNNVSVAMKAPTTEGKITGYWRMQNAAGTTFGPQIYVQVVVSNKAITLTLTPKATGEPTVHTSTPHPTSTPTATTQATEVPSVVPSAVVEPSAVPSEDPTPGSG